MGYEFNYKDAIFHMVSTIPYLLILISLFSATQDMYTMSISGDTISVKIRDTENSDLKDW